MLHLRGTATVNQGSQFALPRSESAMFEARFRLARMEPRQAHTAPPFDAWLHDWSVLA